MAGPAKSSKRKNAPLRPSKGVATPDVSAGAKKHAAEIVRVLRRTYPDAICTLDFTTPLELLVATILSAQCTDERVNIVTKDLFRKYRSAADFARAPIGQLEKDIQTTGFFRAKAKNIKNCCLLLVEQHDGQVPQSIEQLVELPGIGRKTASVVLGTAFGIASGVVVDTHVTRLSSRMGLTCHKDPGKIEKDLMALIPSKEWIAFSHRMIQHGRKICTARSPSATFARWALYALGLESRGEIMVLSGYEIQRQLGQNIVIEPFDESRLNPNSYNLTLHDELLIYEEVVLDMRRSNRVRRMAIPPEGLVLQPHQLYLGRTRERTETRNYVPMIEGRSSIGRLGLFVHVTAGFGDVGFCGYWTLEMFAVQPVRIYAGVAICQIFYHDICGTHSEYASDKYQNNNDIQPSLLFKELSPDGEDPQRTLSFGHERP